MLMYKGHLTKILVYLCLSLSLRAGTKLHIEAASLYLAITMLTKGFVF